MVKHTLLYYDFMLKCNVQGKLVDIIEYFLENLSYIQISDCLNFEVYPLNVPFHQNASWDPFLLKKFAL